MSLLVDGQISQEKECLVFIPRRDLILHHGQVVSDIIFGMLK